MKKVGLGLIGLGYVGKIHFQHSRKLDNASLVAVSDLSKKALKAARNAGVKKTFTNYEQLLKDSDIDAVIIALPTHLHLECARKAAEAKKDIFLEKPVARNVTEAQEIVSCAQRNSVKLMIGYPLRFNRKFSEIKEKIKSGTLGDVKIAHATYISAGPFFQRTESYSPIPVPEWWFKKEYTGGGALIDIGSHMINLLRWYFGEVKDIRSLLGYRFNMDLEDSAICLAKFESGTAAVISVGWFSQKLFLEINLHGSVNNITVGRSRENRLLTAVQMLTTGTSKFFQSHFAGLQYFVDCLIHDLPPSPSGEDGVRDLEAISMAYENQIHLD
ncbi:MAG: Gfo/Idh/MocA family oxidoreductase [Candidatus Bathyarchaeota archaeon]|nr:Gfo/Idh/MocA family oxidoreductase [Candidatus Bathyarchaeota archaeon]MDH5787846.1 Gfo/Idh/MocA family oxidoreductase [Candidatus Bathyarchaeota archaeon]